MDNCVGWYREFFELEQSWEINRFSELTRSRLPRMTRLTELTAENLRFHIFDGASDQDIPRSASCPYVQHICLQVSGARDLEAVRDRWIKLYSSGRFTFSRTDLPTAIVEDADGSASLYLYDVNGLEFEFTWRPRVFVSENLRREG
jgi:hypothetical protein